MIRACLFGAVCCVALGSFGLPSVAATHAAAADGPHAGWVSAPAAPDAPCVVEGKPLVSGALLERSEPGTQRPAARSTVALKCVLHVAGHAAIASFTHDARYTSRMSRAAARSVDLRREIFRTHPARRVGRGEAAPAQPC